MSIDFRYWDASCFFAVLKGEPEAIECQGVMEAAQDGRLTIMTSTWTLIEIVHLKSGRDFGARDDATIAGFFEQPFIVLRPFTEAIANSARRLVWERQFSREDAIHAATALDHGCPALDTFDAKFAGREPLANLRIGRPDIAHEPRLPDIG